MGIHKNIKSVRGYEQMIRLRDIKIEELEAKLEGAENQLAVESDMKRLFIADLNEQRSEKIKLKAKVKEQEEVIYLFKNSLSEVCSGTSFPTQLWANAVLERLNKLTQKEGN